MDLSTYKLIECVSILQFWNEYQVSQDAVSRTNQMRDLEKCHLGFVDHDRKVWVTVWVGTASMELSKCLEGVAPEIWQPFRTRMRTLAGRDLLFGPELGNVARKSEGFLAISELIALL